MGHGGDCLLMSRLRRRAIDPADEGGAALAMVVIWLPVLLLFMVFVIDVGNWFVHQRHLQLQADAAAFAGGDNFQACFGGGAGDSAIFGAASTYAGTNGTFGGG